MKRWFLAIAVLLGGTAVAVRADYVIIRLNLAVTQDPDAEKNQTAGGGEGMPGTGGMPGMGGMPIGGGLGGRMGGAGRGQGGPMGPGMGGLRGGGQMGPGQGNLGGGPQMGGMGNRGGPGMGGMGNQGGGGPPMGGMGNRGGLGMGGMGSGPGMGGGMGTLMTQPAGLDEEEDSTPLLITIIVEVDHKDLHYNKTTGRLHIRHKWGTTYLPYPNAVFTYQVIQNVDTVAKEYEIQKKEKLNKDDDPNKADNLLEVAQWALEHGMLDKVPELMVDLAKLDPKHQAVIAFQKIQTDMNRKITQDDAAINWKERLGNYQTQRSDHYTLLFEREAQAEANNRLKLLEQNYAGFFYWFALKGRTLPVPTRRLVAVLVKNKEVFDPLQKDVFDDCQMVADGFYARRDNLAVFSAKPIDEGYSSLEEVSKTWLPKWKREDLLKGDKTFSDKDRRKGAASFDEKAYFETVALIFQAKEAESALASVSHEGTRQLIAAIGLLPRNVEAPEWIDFGMASFFETPKGSFWSGVGGENLPYHANFYVWAKTKNKKLDKNAVEALKGVVTDRYFREANSGKKKESALIRARTMAWALTYFLARQKREGLLRYYEELAGMPRDMEFDDDVLLRVFARAFGLVDVNKPNEMDETKVGALARSWYQFMDLQPRKPEELFRDVDARTKKAPPKTRRPADNKSSGPIQ